MDRKGWKCVYRVVSQCDLIGGLSLGTKEAQPTVLKAGWLGVARLCEQSPVTHLEAQLGPSGGERVQSEGALWFWDHRDPQRQLNSEADRGMASPPLPREQSLLRFMFLPNCKFQMSDEVTSVTFPGREGI